MTLDELGIDPIPILRLKLVEKAAVAVGILVLIGLGYWYFWFGDRQMAIEDLERQIAVQLKEIATKKQTLARLPEMRQRYADLQQEEQKALEVLPSSKEIPALLTDISQAGHQEGLEFLLFKPELEIPTGFYAEVPVSLEVVGNYHAIALFMDRVAKMSRLVNISDITVVPAAPTGGGKGGADKAQLTDKLDAKARATTYRFLDESEQKAFQDAQRAKNAPKKR